MISKGFTMFSLDGFPAELNVVVLCIVCTLVVVIASMFYWVSLKKTFKDKCVIAAHYSEIYTIR